MEITLPQTCTPPDSNPPSSTLGQTLQPIPEEEEAAGRAGLAAAAVEAAAKPDESAALSVGCALLMQLALEEGLGPRLCASASVGMHLLLFGSCCVWFPVLWFQWFL